jgi:hypothetical protein
MEPCVSCTLGPSYINTTGDFTSDGWNVSFGHGFAEYGYWLPGCPNEVVVSGCNVMVTLHDHKEDTGADIINAGCATFCTTKQDEVQAWWSDTQQYCIDTGVMRCCQARIIDNVYKQVRLEAKWLCHGGNHTAEQHRAPVNVFVAEEGWFNGERVLDQEVLLLLGWGITQGLPPIRPAIDVTEFCDEETISKLCKSQHSMCWKSTRGFGCHCQHGYDGNPYLAGGCQG